MTDFRRFPEGTTRQIIDYNRFMELTGTKVFLCLDKGVIEIARYLLNTRGTWRTTYVKEYVGTIGYNMPTETEFQNVLQAIARSNIDMASCDDIVDALNGIKLAITETSTSGSGCCAIGGDTPLTDVSDTEPVTEPDREGDPPSGNSSWEEFDQHKCDWIHKILDDFKNTLRNYGSFFGFIGVLTMALIAAATLIIMPPIALAILAGALGALVVIDITSFAFFTLLVDALDDDEDLICDLYNCTSTDEMVGVMYDRFTTIIPGLEDITPTIEAKLLEAVSAMNTNTLWAQALNNEGLSPEGYEMSSCPCLGCSGDIYQPSPQTGLWGIVNSWDGITLEGESEVGDNGAHRFNWQLLDGGTPCCRQIETISIIGSDHEEFFDYYVPCGSSETAAPSNDANNLAEECINAFILASDNPFTITVTFYSGECVP